MGSREVINDTLVNLFNEILKLEEDVLVTGEFQNISVNDFHVINAIGMEDTKNMSTIAKQLDITVGSLTTAINALVRKGYVVRERSEMVKILNVNFKPRVKFYSQLSALENGGR